MIIDRIENWKKYFDGPVWQKAFEYLGALGPDSPDTEMLPLMGDNLKGRVMTYDTKTPEDAEIIEAHDQYVDIQMSLRGTEIIDWFPRAALTVKTPYNAESDAVFFGLPGPSPVRVRNEPGMFTVLFPQDAHMPGLNPGAASENVKKVVVKVKKDSRPFGPGK
jgi:YhcH/YjgK/YiaL family protein